MPPPRMPTFSQTILELVRQARTSAFLSAMNLGGAPGPNGGSGSPPGAPIGTLNQTRVSYDQSEKATYQYESSLLDNLNHLRAEIYQRGWWGL